MGGYTATEARQRWKAAQARVVLRDGAKIDPVAVHDPVRARAARLSARARVAFGEWNEADHPRGEHGRFGDAAGAHVATNGPMTDAAQAVGLAHRAEVAAKHPDEVAAVDRWQGGMAGMTREAADHLIAGTAPARDNYGNMDRARVLLGAVDEAAPSHVELVRGLVLEHPPAAGDTLHDPLGSWTENRAVAANVMDIRQKEGVAGERVLLVTSDAKAVPVSALAKTGMTGAGQVYAYPDQVTAQEHLSGGEFHVDRVEHSRMPGGLVEKDGTWRFKANGDKPVTIVHVTQTGTYGKDGAFHAR